MQEHAETISKLTGRTLGEVAGTINSLIIEGKTAKEVEDELFKTLQISMSRGY